MAALGELYSFREEFIENSVIKVVTQGTGTPIVGVSVTVNYTGFGETSKTSVTDANGLTEFFLVDVASSDLITVNVEGSPITENYNHLGTDLEVFCFEIIVTESEILKADLDNDCADQEYFLTWINSLGGYEFWRFTARATKGIRGINKNVFSKDVFANWDNGFINGVRDKKILENRAEPTLTLRTQFLTEDQAEALSKIPQSNAVFLIQNGVEVPVQVDTSTLQFFTDRQKTIELEFQITLPERYSQTS